MAHTNETTNYHLSQFVGTDIPNPLVDYNGDMVKIDTAIKGVADASAGYASDIADLEIQNGSETLTTTAQTLSGAVNELDGEVGDINTRLTTAEGKITADEGTLATAVSNISTLSGKVSAVETKVGTAVLTTVASDCSGAINELKAEIDGSGVDSLATRITALETQNGNAVLVTTAQTLSGAINELAQGGSATVDADDVTYDNTDSGLTAVNVQDAIDEVVAEMNTVAYSTAEKKIGTDADGSDIYEKTYYSDSVNITSTEVIDATLTSAYVGRVISIEAALLDSTEDGWLSYMDASTQGTRHVAYFAVRANGLDIVVGSSTVSKYHVTVRYTKA